MLLSSKVRSSPSPVITTASVNTNEISPPYAPAFIYNAPPTEPGIPQANSRPVKLWSSAIRDTSIIAAPHCATIVVPVTVTPVI